MEEETQMTNQYFVKCSTSFPIEKMQIQTTLRFHLLPVRLAIKKSNNKCCLGCGERGTLHASILTTKNGSFSTKFENRTTWISRYTTAGYVTQRAVSYPNVFVHPSYCCSNRNKNQLEKYGTNIGRNFISYGEKWNKIFRKKEWIWGLH